MVRLIFLSCLLITLSCKSSKQSASNEFPMIMMEKTACMGTCPVYVFNVYPDGTATYKGTQNVTNIGEFTAKLTEEQLNGLKNSFDEADFFNFANVYSANVTDLPTTFIYYHNGKENSKVTDYFDAPEALKALEKEVERVIALLNWQKK